MKPSSDDDELAHAFLAREPEITWMAVARLICEVRTEQAEFDAEVCEQYAEDTTFVRKSMAAKECAKRIRRGPNTGPVLPEWVRAPGSRGEGT